MRRQAGHAGSSEWRVPPLAGCSGVGRQRHRAQAGACRVSGRGSAPRPATTLLGRPVPGSRPGRSQQRAASVQNAGQRAPQRAGVGEQRARPAALEDRSLRARHLDELAGQAAPPAQPSARAGAPCSRTNESRCSGRKGREARTDICACRSLACGSAAFEAQPGLRPAASPSKLNRQRKSVKQRTACSAVHASVSSSSHSVGEAELGSATAPSMYGLVAHPLPDGVAPPLQAVELAALDEHRRLGRVQAPGLALVEDAAAEPGSRRPAPTDREHDPVPKAIVAFGRPGLPPRAR